jgi:mono/diheme cytochrome c family protein
MKPKLLALGLFLGFILATLFLSGCSKTSATGSPEKAFGAYDSESDWNDATKSIKLGYQESQGKRVFYQYCVWCHADATPAGPSNCSHVTPVPSLMNDGEKLNPETDEYLQNIIALGGSALGKSAMMPPYGNTLAPHENKAVIAYTRAIANPEYQKLGHPASQVSSDSAIGTAPR